jgi:hypothetical protein
VLLSVALTNKRKNQMSQIDLWLFNDETLLFMIKDLLTMKVSPNLKKEHNRTLKAVGKETKSRGPDFYNKLDFDTDPVFTEEQRIEARKKSYEW